MSTVLAPSSGNAILPYGLDLRKATSLSGGGSRPAYIAHGRSDAARRYLHTGLGIIDDTTPHLEANMLRRVSEKNPILAACIRTILRKVTKHFRKPTSDKALGIRVKQREAKKAMTEAASKRVDYLESILFNGGIVTNHPITGEPAVWDGHYEERADNLTAAVGKLMYDSLVLDRTMIEREPSAKIAGKPKNPIMYWKAADAGLMRMVDSRNYEPTIRTDLSVEKDGERYSKAKYVMLDPMANQFSVMREYTWEEGVMAFRNPRTEFGAFGYGRSETDECVDAIVGILYGMQSNKEYFTSNHIPQGILNVIGTYSEDALGRLRTSFKQQIGTPEHYYEFPVFATSPGQGAGAQWIPLMDRSRQDMVFQVYMQFCTAIVAAVFQIQPEEFGMQAFGTSTSSLNSANPESTFEQSEDKGTLPRVLWLCDLLSRELIQFIDPDFECIIQGLDAIYSEEMLLQAEYEQTLMANGYTPNMIRRRNDEPPIIDPIQIELWRDIEKQFEDKWFANDTLRTEAMREVYEKKGGKLGSWPDAPISNAGALQIWQQEHGMTQDQETGEDMRNAANNAQAGDQENQAADAQGARDHMFAMQQGEDQRDADQQSIENADKAEGSLRIPQAMDARTRVPQSSSSSFGKSYAKSRRKVIDLGPRDG